MFTRVQLLLVLLLSFGCGSQPPPRPELFVGVWNSGGSDPSSLMTIVVEDGVLVATLAPSIGRDGGGRGIASPCKLNMTPPSTVECSSASECAYFGGYYEGVNDSVGFQRVSISGECSIITSSEGPRMAALAGEMVMAYPLTTVRSEYGWPPGPGASIQTRLHTVDGNLSWDGPSYGSRWESEPDYYEYSDMFAGSICRDAADKAALTCQNNGNRTCSDEPWDCDPWSVYLKCVNYVNTTVRRASCPSEYAAFLQCVASQPPMCPDAWATCGEPYYAAYLDCYCAAPFSDEVRTWCATNWP